MTNCFNFMSNYPSNQFHFYIITEYILIVGEEFWIGLRNIYKLTNIAGRPMELKVVLEKKSGEKAHALYKNFRIGTEVSSKKYYYIFNQILIILYVTDCNFYS